MYNRIRRLYIEEGKLDIVGVHNAVKAKLITQEEYFQLTGRQYTEELMEERSFDSVEDFQKAQVEDDA